MDQTDHDLLITAITKLDSISECLADISEWEKRMDDRVRMIDISTSGNAITIESVKKDVQEFRNRSNLYDSLLAILAIVGSLIVAIFDKK